MLTSSDCSQSPIFSWDRLDIPRLTVTAILLFKDTEGAGVGDYSSSGGRSWSWINTLVKQIRDIKKFSFQYFWRPDGVSIALRQKVKSFSFNASFHFFVCTVYCCIWLLSQNLPWQKWGNREKIQLNQTYPFQTIYSKFSAGQRKLKHFSKNSYM